jgi:MFS family permease
MFFSPIWVIYLQQERGLSIFQVTLIDVTFWGTSLLLSLPVGVIADSFGRKRSMMLALLSMIGGVLLFVVARSFPLLMFANVLFALAFAFGFGAILSLFYDSLKQVGREEEFTKQRGLLSAVMFGSAAVSSVIGGLLGDIDLKLPFFAYAVVNVFTFFILLSLKETPFEPHPETGKRISYGQALTTTFRAIRENANLRYILLYSNLIPLATVILGQVFLQPYALSIGIPIAALGLVSFGVYIIRMLGSSNADKLVIKFGEWRWLSLAPLLVIAGTFGLGLIRSWPGILAFALVGFGATATRPLIETLILRNAPGTVRSTILSIDMMLFNLFVVLTEPGLGYLGDNWGIPAAFLAMAGFSLVTLGLVLVFWRRVWKSTAELAA